MYHRWAFNRFRGHNHFLLAFLILVLGSCDGAPDPSLVSGALPSDALIQLAGTTPTSVDVDESDVGNGFAEAQDVPIAEAGKTTIHGRLTAGGDIDLFRFGPVAAGDVLIADVQGPGADLRAALFDSTGSVIQSNDDRNYYAGIRDPRIQIRLRIDDDYLYLAVAGKNAGLSLFGPPADGTDYTVALAVLRGLEVLPPNPQTVYLQFGGGAGVRIAGEPLQDVPPFDAGRIHPRYRADQDRIIDIVVEKLAADYADYRVELHRGDREPPPERPYAVLFFGGFSSRYLGLADNVDWYNGETAQEAIIYTDTLSLFEALQPSSEQVALAIANVASHELGHLLGLEHTLGTSSVMSEAASAQAILSIDARLITAPLNTRVFPTGWQNAPLKLALGVGLRDPSMGLEAFLESRHDAAQLIRADYSPAAAAAADPGANPSDNQPDEGPSQDPGDLSLESLGLHMCNHDGR